MPRMGFIRFSNKTMEKGSSSSSSSSSSVKQIYFEGLPPKRGRSGAAAQGGQPPRCQVEGCRVDLSDAKAYYCRHKVCGMHSKSPKVVVAGIEQRFCQQCSRFHQLPEFDQGKRSCRRRLAGHNERRRKPPPGPLLPSRYGSPSTFDNHGKSGSFLMDFSGYSTPTTGRGSWLIPPSGRGLSNQVTIAEKYELSWPSTSQNPPVPFNLLQGQSTSEGCYDGASNSNAGALSLLSNESWSSRNQRALSLGANSFLGPHTVQPSADGQFPFAPWGNQGGDSIHEMGPDMGLAAAISNQTSSGPFSGGDIGLTRPSEARRPDEIEPSRGYDSPAHHMHWSL